MSIAYMSYGIAVLLIVLGFVALITQKIYVDRDTQQPVEVEIPLLGKLKTNVPALAFLFGGLVLAYVTFDRAYPPRLVPWQITGHFHNNTGQEINFSDGKLDVVPRSLNYGIADNGEFWIELMLEEGRSFEQAIELIRFSHSSLQFIEISPNDEYRALRESRESMLRRVGLQTASFKPIPVALF